MMRYQMSEIVSGNKIRIRTRDKVRENVARLTHTRVREELFTHVRRKVKNVIADSCMNNVYHSIMINIIYHETE